MSATTNYQPVTTGAVPGTEKTVTTIGSAAAPQATGVWTRITDKLPFLRTKRGLAVTIIAILVIIGGGLAGLAALHNRNSNESSTAGPGTTTSSNAISSDEHFFGQSPPIYPSRGCYRHISHLSKDIIFIESTDAYSNTFLQQIPLAQEHGPSRSNAPKQWWQI